MQGVLRGVDYAPLEYGTVSWASDLLHATRLCLFGWRRGLLPFLLGEGKYSSTEGASGVHSSLVVGGAHCCAPFGQLRSLE